MRVFQLAAAALASLAAGCVGPAPEDAAVASAGDAAMGRDLFVARGCVLCHAVNGVGGKAAPPLDAAEPAAALDPLAFAARMWQGAPAMVDLQTVELGYVIELSGDDIRDLAAFAAAPDEQKKLTRAALPEAIRDSLIDERYWETDEWPDYEQPN